MSKNRNINYLFIGAAVLILLATVTACGQTSDITPNTNGNANGTNSGTGNRNRGTTSVESSPVALRNLTPSGVLTDVEAEGLLFMQEEEKLARDVYLALYDLWGMPVFSNIAQSESAHMEAVLTLLNGYGLDDPAAATAEGEFTNPDLQAIYDQFVAQGSQSLVEALRVGAAIEEIDILDLEEYIGQTEKADLINVYNNLLSGSQNHLRAFVSNLERQTGETYVPQYLDQDAYDAIMNASTGRGSGGKGGRGGGQGRNPNGRTP